MKFFAFCMFVFLNAAHAQSVPHFQVDPSWPKPLPNRWILG